MKQCRVTKSSSVPHAYQRKAAISLKCAHLVTLLPSCHPLVDTKNPQANKNTPNPHKAKLKSQQLSLYSTYAEFQIRKDTVKVGKTESKTVISQL